jgi:hypothetical protein
MLAAERRRKIGELVLGDDLARAEDFVTSTVFGLLSYLPVDRGLGAVLRGLFGDPGLPSDARLVLWPRGDDRTEPDLAIVGTDAIAVVEVKLDAPFGPQQLGREWLWLQARRRGGPHTRAVIATITRHPLGNRQLRERIVADLRALGSDDPGPLECDVRSVTWHELGHWILEPNVTTLEAHIAAVLEDLDYFLRSRGLRLPPFDSWPLPTRRWPARPIWYARPYFDGGLAPRASIAQLWASEPYFYLTSEAAT